MRLSTLSLTDFRSYADAEVTLHRGPNVLLGFNGVGKTNIAEAIAYLSTLSSHRVPHDAPLVRHGQNQAIIRVQAHRGPQDAMLDVEINPGRGNRVRINRGNPVRASEALGILRTVLFAPEDLELIKGSPSVRRRLFDDLAVQLRPALARTRLDYEKVLRQRNALLKSIRREGFTATHESTLTVWDQQLAEAGSRLLQARLQVLSALRPHVEQAYQEISGSVRTARLEYQSSVTESSQPGVPQAYGHDLESMDRLEIAERLRESLQRARREERERAQTLVGPHRDEILMSLDQVPVKGFASHGETWSFALALRLAAYRAMIDDDPAEGSRPILILDDVFAELDARRRARLAELVSEAEQLIVTAAVDEDVPESLMRHAYRVESVDQLSSITAHPHSTSRTSVDGDPDEAVS